MNPSVLSLRCPNCGRPFLSLPQQPGAQLTCPHCAQSAQMSSFLAGGSTPQGQAVPFRRRIITPPTQLPERYPQNQPSPFSQAQNPTYLERAHPTQPVYQNLQKPHWIAPATPVSRPNQSGWPPAPEKRPMFAPVTATEFPQAPESAILRPHPSAATAITPATFASPFTQATLPTEPSGTLFSISQAEDVRFPIDLPINASFVEVSQTPWKQPKQRSSTALAITLLIIIVGVCLWVLKDDLLPPLVTEIPINSALKETTSASPATIPSLQTPTLEPEPEVRRAEVIVPPVDLVAAGAAAENLFKALIEAKNPEERLTLIASQEEYATDVAEFFNGGKPEMLSFKPSNATLRHLPSQEIAPMFQIVTKQCPTGAMMRVVQKPGGGFLLDWPLFAESHAQKLVKFIGSKSTQPAWHHVCLRRDHGLELPEEERELQVSFTLQGSLDTSGKCAAVAQKGSSICRYLSRETEWGTIYVARLLLQHRAIKNGDLAITILDCEGAAAGSSQ